MLAVSCNFLSEEKVEEVVKSTMVGGATLTGLLGTSAWMAPGAAASAVAESIIKNQGKMITCAAYLDGEYGMKDIMIGVPVVLGKNGIERIVEIELTEDEKAKFAASEALHRGDGADVVGQQFPTTGYGIFIENMLDAAA